MLGRNFFLKHVSEVQIEVTERRKRRRKQQLLDDLKETTRHWKLKEEALDRTFCRTTSRLGRGYGPVVKTDYMTMNVITHSGLWVSYCVRDPHAFRFAWSCGKHVWYWIIKCFWLNLKPFLHHVFPSVIFTVDVISSLLILRLSGIRWSIRS